MDVKKEIKEHYSKRKVDEKTSKLYGINEYTDNLNITLEQLKNKSNMSNEKLMDSLHAIKKVVNMDK